MANGCTAKDIFSSRTGFTYDDIIFLPGRIDFSVDSVQSNTKLTRNIRIDVPLVASPMDTVCEEKMAETLALMGACGVIHSNCSVASQLEKVQKVKAFTGALGARSSLGEDGYLLVGAACNTNSSAFERAKALIDGGVDFLVIDSSQGNSMYQEDLIKNIKKNFSIDIIGGNIVTAAQAKPLLNAGVDGLRIGMGSGAICTTQDVCAVGRAQGSAVYHVCDYLHHEAPDVPGIADGGIQTSGQILKALSLGASSVMCGSFFAGTDEAPGEVFTQEGVPMKTYRGMGSMEVLSSQSEQCQNEDAASTARYLIDEKKLVVAQGVSGAVKAKGSVKELVPYVMQGVKHGLQDMGIQSIEKLHLNLRSGDLKMELRSNAAIREGGVHRSLKQF
eukprot:GHVP01066353.1.p1 GENE.GHVP01066353.1~~GHVP01066353.1.p1  ORF type:complete len:389 (+),score=74.36 GHVP01066353.1:28-1194(+)